MERVKINVAEGVLTATLADVEHRNALGDDFLGELSGAIKQANADSTIRAMVIGNAGNTWCAGANLKEQVRRNEAGESTALPAFPTVLAEIQDSPTPIIAKVEGHVLGGGTGLAAVCDISIARDDVQFGFSEVRLGVTPAIVSVVCLPKMRLGEAMEAFLRGNRFGATEAAAYGLINRAVPAESLDAAVADVVADLEKGGPDALGITKRLVYEVRARAQADAFEWTTKLSAECFASAEAREGMSAFLERRPPKWLRNK
jgi:methylglutaconyl-CoA hydratase